MRRVVAALLIWLFAAPQLFAESITGAVAQKKLLGQLRPLFALPDRSGEMQSITLWNGRIVVLNFWATWCTPCRAEIPLLNTLHDEFNSRSVQIIGIAIDNADAVRKFEQQVVPLSYPVVIGGTDAIDVAARYGNAAGALPYTVFIRRDGTIEALASGALTENYVRRTLGKMMPPIRE